MLNALTIAVEVVGVVVVLVLLGLVIRVLLRSLAASPTLERARPTIEAMRRNLRLLLVLLGVLGCLAIGGVNGYWWYVEDRNLVEHTLGLLQSIPSTFWIDLAIAAAKVLAVCVLATVALRVLRRLLHNLCTRAKKADSIKANDASIDQFFTLLQTIVRRATWLWVLLFATRQLGLPERAITWAAILLRIYLTIAIGLLAWRAVDTVIVSLDGLSKKYAHSRGLLLYYERLQGLVPLFRRCVEYTFYIVVATLVVAQIELVASLADWGPKLVNIVGVGFLARVAIEVIDLLVDELFVQRARLDDEQRKRRLTLVPLLRSILQYVAYFTAGVVILGQLGIDPTPILAGAGILALAVGMGAQTLVNDIVSGFFLLFENHFLVGDEIKVGDTEGTVEAIELRTTRIRDDAGGVHILRNGQIESLINYSKAFACAVVDVGVAYEADLERVKATLLAIGQELKDSNPDVLTATEVQGIEKFGESDVVVRTITCTKPGRRQQVQNDLRARIKQVFDAQGIEFPYVRRVLIFQNATPAPAPAAPETGLPSIKDTKAIL